MRIKYKKIISGKRSIDQNIITFFGEKNPYTEINTLYVKAIFTTDIEPLKKIISENEGLIKVLVMPLSLEESNFYMTKGINLNAEILSRIRNIYQDVSFL